MDRIYNRYNASESTSLQNSVSNQSSWKKRCCHSSNSDGFTVISTCFFVLTVAVTCSLIIQIHFGGSEVTPHGAVASDDQVCSEIGIHSIKEGGSAVDAAIASLLCLSVTHPHLVGPGGGGVMLIHDYKLNKSKVLDFTVSFPSDGGRIGVPGFLKGLEKAHNLYGKLPWKSLFQPAIALARDGFTVSEQLSKAVSHANVALFSPNFRTEFFPKGVATPEGQNFTRKKFSQFLKDVSVGGADELHLLRYGVETMEAFKLMQANISVHDFHNYEVKERKVVKERVNNVTIATVGPPFGGLQVIAGLELMKELGVTSQTSQNKLYDSFTQGLLLGAALNTIKFNPDSDLFNETSSLLARVTSQHFSFADIHRSVEDTPASQVSAVDTFDLYAAAIVGLGDSFGSGVMTEHGIILNRSPESSSDPNSASYGRHSTAFTPLIAFDANNICGERVVLSSGSWSAMLQAVTQLIFRNLDLTSAIVEPRIALGNESSVLLLNDSDPKVKKLPSSVREYLKGRNFTLKGPFIPLGVNGVSKVGDSLISHSDIRGGGVAARLHQNLKTSKNDSTS